MTAFTQHSRHRTGWLAAFALAASIVLGGGGSPAPMAEIALQLVVALVVAAWLLTPDRPAVPRSARIVAALLICVPVLQLAPLPPALWHVLPGRAQAAEALALVGQDGTWRAWSLAPDRTLASVLAILPAGAMVMLSASLDRTGATRLLLIVLGGGLLTLLVGAAQLSGGPGSPFRFYEPESLFLDGFQANHNSAADVLLIALVAANAAIRELAAAGRLPDRRGVVLGLAGGLTLLIGLGVVLTNSRAGIALLPVALGASLVVLRPWLSFSPRAIGAWTAATAAAGAIAVVAAARNDALARVVARFGIGPDMRPDLWRDSLFTARQYFPFGTGMGDFVPAMLANERLGAVRELVPNRAHNEILELAVEAGAFGLIAWAVIAAIVLNALRTTLRRVDPGPKGLAIFAGSALLILTLHSLVDYPFRSMALAMLAGACAGLLLRAPSAVQEEVE
jgi:O-antigen ligase